MKVEVKNGAVVATSETVEEAAALIKFTRPVVVATAPVAATGKRGGRRKYLTVEERKAAKARYSRRYYKKQKALKEAAKTADMGTPVAITKI